MADVVAVILAGGQGKRMGELCAHRPKPLLPFAGTHRVIDFALSNCLHSRFSNVAVLTDYLRSDMANYLKQWQASDVRSKSMQMDILDADEHYLGTADAVYQNLEYLFALRVRTVLVLAADHVYKMDYRKMLSFHERAKADVTMEVVKFPVEEAQRFGTVRLGADDRILDFAEKSGTRSSNVVSMGIYVFDVEALIRSLLQDAMEPDSAHDFGYSILPRLVAGGRGFAYRFDGYWRDVGTIPAYHAANLELAGQKSTFRLGGYWPVITAQAPLVPPVIISEEYITASIVSPGCIVKGRVENSVLGPGVLVEEDATVRNSVLMDGVHIGRHAAAENCIMDEGARAGDFCRLGGQGKARQALDEIAVVARNVITLPDSLAGLMEMKSVVDSGADAGAEESPPQALSIAAT